MIMKKTTKTICTLIAAAAFIALLVFLESNKNKYGMAVTVLQKGFILAVVAVSMNLLNGFTGLFSLGQAGFMALGAYTYAIFTIPLESRASVYYISGMNPVLAGIELPMLVALIAGGLVAALFAAVIGFPVLRLKSDYLAIATLGFSEIIRALIASPQMDTITNGSYGLKSIPAASIYVVVGLVIAVLGGTLIEKLHMEQYVEEFIRNASSVDLESPTLTKRDRVIFAKDQVVSTFKKVFPYILVGVGIGAIIHNWIPESWIQTVLGSNNPFGVFLAVLVGVPMYADIFGTIPVAEALLAKGAQLGTILSFMMAVTTLSLPSMIMLRKAVKPKLLALFIGICTIGIIIVGYLFNVFQFLLI